jgi:hypothetical protein
MNENDEIGARVGGNDRGNRNREIRVLDRLDNTINKTIIAMQLKAAVWPLECQAVRHMGGEDLA